ncbi:DUF106 domain-containing protein [Halocatena marina]|uniref:DUF106 domain-containing protein n=1 Tax=Halocatena marina TaxID=2934937 RepID=UPI00200DB213|nr:EMC3/TMCO1 family protein [Halocatena marina]
MVLESSGWTAYDTAASVFALALLSGYAFAPIQIAVATTLNLVLSPLATLIPLSLFLLGLSGVTGISATALRHLLLDNDRLDRLQSRITELQEKIAAGQNDDEAIDAVTEEQQELVNSTITMMKLQFRPMVWSMIVTVPVFLWLRWAVMAPTAAAIPVALTLPVVGQIALSATLIGPLKVWIVWYIGGSISASVLSRRLLARVTH